MKNQLILLALLGLNLASCRKDKEDPITTDNTSAIDYSLAEGFFDDMLRLSDDAASDNGLKGVAAGCVDTVIIDLSSLPYIMLIDLGPVNCTGSDGRNRRGQILVSFTGAYRDVGTVITITPQNFYINDHQVQGSKTVTNMGPNTNGHTYFNIAVNGTVTAPDGTWTSSHQAQRTRTWVAGESTWTYLDDIYEIGGTGSGVNRNGLPYALQINAPLRVELSCSWVVSGSLEITPDQLATRYFDFGNGACDNAFSVTLNGTTYNFGSP